MKMKVKAAATAIAIVGWLALTVGLSRAPQFAASVVQVGPGFWARWLLVVALFIIHATRRNSIAYMWTLLGAISWALFFGPIAQPGWLLLLGAGAIHLASTRPGWLLLSAPCWWIVGLSCQFVTADVITRAAGEQSGVRVTSAPVTVASRWLLGVALTLFVLRYLAQSIVASRHGKRHKCA